MAPNDRVHRVVYGSQHMRDPSRVILDIIRVSETRNLSLGCSGLLLYGSHGYFQVIEGPLPRLEELFASISKDERHLVIWHEFSSLVRREISLTLPMGYFDDSECHKNDLKLPSIDMGPAQITDTIMKAAARKYPSAIL